MVRCPPAKHAADETTASKYRRRCEMGTARSSKSHLLAWYAFAACWRWNCKSNFFSDPYAPNMQPNHFCATLPGRTLSVTPWLIVIVEGGWLWLVKRTVLFAFNKTPTSDNSATKLSNSFLTSMAERAKSRMSSANRRSMRCGIPSDKSKPRSPTFILHFRMANCNTAQKRRGLKTHPCRTPPVMLNFLLRPVDPMTSANCPSYNFEIIEIVCSEMPCSSKPFQSAGQWTRSNAFDKSKLTTHTGIPTSKALSRNTFAVKKCFSMRLPRRKPGCSSGWWSSSWCSILSRTRHANTLYNKRMLAMGLKSATCCGRIFLGNMLNKVQNHDRGTAPW